MRKQTYSLIFQALKLSETMKNSQIARELNISPQLAGRWLNKAREIEQAYLLKVEMPREEKKYEIRRDNGKD